VQLGADPSQRAQVGVRNLLQPRQGGGLAKSIESAIEEGPIGRRYRYEKAFNAACHAAEIEGFRFHGPRHSAATYLAREGATEQQLRAIGGWKPNVLGRYVRLAAQDATAVLERMNAKILDVGTVKGDGR